MAPMNRPKYLTKRLLAALGAYLALALVATFALDGMLRTVMWIFFAGLAVRTLIAAREQDQDNRNDPDADGA
jgi:hypothetical protein